MLTLDFNPFPVITTDRLILREIGYLDAGEIFVFRSDPRIMTYLDRTPDMSIEQAHQFIAHVKEAQNNNDSVMWGISLKTDHKLIGTCGFWRIEKAHHRAEIGYTLHPDHQGKGYMNEATAAVLSHGFNKMNLHSVEANVNPNNVASISLLEKNGFVKEGHFKENWFHDGKFSDSAIYSLVRS
ncbi:MAG: family N-acetyltransferase [Bacteroidetes bacterium]|nr:family N-acetyltransferase [Bacteroidota bacterium]